MRRSPVVLSAAVALLLTGCGSSEQGSAPVTSTVLVTATPTGSTPATSSAAPAPTTTAPVTTVAVPDATTDLLRSATVPALNDRPAMTMRKGRARASGYECTLGEVAPVLADVDSDGGKEAVGTVTCNGGTSDWPAEVLVVDHDGKTLLDHPLTTNGRMHARVTALEAQAGAVTVGWTSYDLGRGPDVAQTGALRLEKGRAVFVPSGAATTLAPSPGQSTSAPAAATTSSTGFASPSGGILCNLSDTGARCDVTGAQFDAPPKPASCEWEWGFIFELSPGSPGAFGCANDPAYMGGEQSPPEWFQNGVDGTKTLSNGSVVTTLGYGHEIRSAAISCVVAADTGVTCKTLDGSHGFTASKRAYRVW